MQFWSLQGVNSYDSVRELQLELVEYRSKDLIPDTVLFLEHQPVITRGRGLQFTGISKPKQMPLLQPLPSEIQFSESERGGDLTYHGPGQLVIYPICKLDGKGFAPDHDIGGYLRKLENVLIQVLKTRGLTGHIQENATGVWMGEQKVASIGIAIRKWVSYHGIAINCINDLKPFYLISPCGFNPEVMTRLSDHEKLSESNWRQDLEISFAAQMQPESPQILSMDLKKAFDQIRSKID